MFYSLHKERFGYSFACLLSRLVIVKAKVHGINLRIVRHHLPQHTVGYAAAGGIAVILLAFLMHGDKTQHIDLGFKQAQVPVGSRPVKTVLRQAAVNISFVGACLSCASLVCVAGSSVCVVADEYSVVIFLGFINHAAVCKGLQYSPTIPHVLVRYAKTLYIVSLGGGSSKCFTSLTTDGDVMSVPPHPSNRYSTASG